MSNLIIPLMIVFIVIWGIIKKCDVYSALTGGIYDGLKTAVSILPLRIGLFAAIGAFHASGAQQLLVNLISPAADWLKIPHGIIPFAVLRPVSGSASLAMAQDIFSKFGADSLEGRAVSVMMGSSETTFYTAAVYFGAVRVVDTRYAVKCALVADICCLFVSMCVCRMWW